MNAQRSDMAQAQDDMAQDISTDLPTKPAHDSPNTVPTPLSPPPESSAQSAAICDCGNPVAEQVCKGRGNVQNKGRMMYVCPRLDGKKCRFFEWKVDAPRSAKTNPQNEDRKSGHNEGANHATETLPATDGSPERELNSVSSNLTPPTTPQRPSRTYNCNCKKPAKEFRCRNGESINIGKYFYRCATGKCKYFKWHESEADARRRIDEKKRKREKNNEGKPKKKFICNCGQPAKRGWSTKGMEHNYGKAFYYCATKSCTFWVWEDGSLPFSDEAQARFNDYWDH